MHNLILQNVAYATLNVANKIFVNEGIQIETEFKELTSEHFFSEVQQVNFANGAEAVSIINNWAYSQTNHRIKEILKKGKLF